MKTNPKTLSLLLLLVTTSLAHGHLLWASHEKCVEELGQPESREPSFRPATEAYAFRKGNWGMIIHFWHDQAQALACVKLDGSDVTPEDMQATLDWYGDGLSWTMTSNGETVRSDRKVVITHKGSGVEIFTREFYFLANRLRAEP